jgi:hypothetical protein
MHLKNFGNPQQVDSSKNYGFAPNIVILVWNMFSDDGSHTSLAAVWKPGIPFHIVRRCSEGVGKQVCFPTAAGPVHRRECTAFEFQGRVNDTVLFCVEANTVYCRHRQVLHWKKPITCSAIHVKYCLFEACKKMGCVMWPIVLLWPGHIERIFSSTEQIITDQRNSLLILIKTANI